MSREIAIIGGGIIGTCTAFYLSRHPKVKGTNTIIRIFEGSSIAAGASGKAGGFLAKDWQDHSPTASLAVLSYNLHEELAKEFDGERIWGYRKLTTVSLDVHHAEARRRMKVPGVEWLTSVSGSQMIGTPQTTAQVHPGEFTRALAQSATKEGGVEIVLANVEELRELAGEGGEHRWEVVAVPSEGGEKIVFEATDVVFAAGPWTGTLAKKLLGAKAGAAATIVPSNCSTSIVVRPDPSKSITAHALFTSLVLPNQRQAAPEVYPRSDGSVYICGAGRDFTMDEADDESDRTPTDIMTSLPPYAKDVVHSPRAARYLRRLAAFISPSHFGVSEKGGEGGGGVTVEVEQACFRPDSSKTGAPIIGKLGEGLWMASGHQVWGINNGPGTGKLLAEMMIDGEATSANIQALSPTRV